MHNIDSNQITICFDVRHLRFCLVPVDRNISPHLLRAASLLEHPQGLRLVTHFAFLCQQHDCYFARKGFFAFLSKRGSRASLTLFFSSHHVFRSGGELCRLTPPFKKDQGGSWYCLLCHTFPRHTGRKSACGDRRAHGSMEHLWCKPKTRSKRFIFPRSLEMPRSAQRGKLQGCQTNGVKSSVLPIVLLAY